MYTNDAHTSFFLIIKVNMASQYGCCYELERRRYNTTLTATTATVQAMRVVCTVDQPSVLFTAGEDLFAEMAFLFRGACDSSR
jgi:hypothetical protein